MSGFARNWRRTLLTWLALALAIVIAISACSSHPVARVSVRYGAGAAAAKLVHGGPPPREDGEDEGDDEDGDEDEAFAESDLAACGRFAGVAVNDVVQLSRNRTEVTATENQAVAVKLSGNHPSLAVDVDASSGAVAAICVIARGNAPRVEMSLAGEVRALRYDGSGNDSAAAIRVPKPGKITGPFQVVLRGNDARVAIDGDGDYACPTSETIGHDPKIVSDRCS